MGWLEPSSLLLTARGLEAKLVRTKVSGPGKRVEAMRVYVSRRAYVAEPRWLEVGLTVRNAVGAGIPYMLPRPRPDLDGGRVQSVSLR